MRVEKEIIENAESCKKWGKKAFLTRASVEEASNILIFLSTRDA